jgi:phosphatidylserine/phosphatidylglycerophosphate/cardiolipin synthase-like enzyme
MLLTINPKNDKIVRYLFKHNLNICKDENIFEVFREYFKKSKHVIISTPYIKKTNMFDSNLSLITVKSLSDFLSTPGNNISIKCLQKKKIDIIFFDGGFVNICKDYAKANFKNNSKLLNSRILKKFRFIMPNGNDLSKKSYFAHSKFYLFDNKHLLIVSANFSENGLKDKSNSGRHTEYDFGVDILLSNTNFKNTVKSTIDNFSFIIDSKNIAAINKTK